jgi:hypothetical protein
MIKYSEILKDQILPEEYKPNMEILLYRLNLLRAVYGRPMTVTSGFRSMEKHIAIYATSHKGKKIPMTSLHLTCEACDISDPKGQLQNFCVNNVPLLENIGLWCEDFFHTRGWVHFQIRPPKSGKRFFVP